MAFVYILHSDQLDKYYIGSCLNLTERLTQHANKTYNDSFTAGIDDWKLFLQIVDLSYNQARGIEAHIKRMKSKTYIQNLLIYPDIILKLKAKYQ